MTESEKIEFLAGRVHALVGFTTAVILSHPRPRVLARHLETIGQANLARAEGVLVDDQYIAGIQDMQDRLRGAVEIALGRPSKPKS